jgi:hypothetical protein
MVYLLGWNLLQQLLRCWYERIRIPDSKNLHSGKQDETTCAASRPGCERTARKPDVKLLRLETKCHLDPRADDVPAYFESGKRAAGKPLFLLPILHAAFL